MSNNCIFCKLRDERVIYECEHTKAFIDTYPASPGHTLIIPKRHFATYFEATDSKLLKRYLMKSSHPTLTTLALTMAKLQGKA